MTHPVRTSPLAFLFNPPNAALWLPAFAAAAISDPVAGEALGPFIGPEDENVGVEDMRRGRVPGEEHFARTWVVIKPGFLGEGSPAYAEHTRDDHRRTQIPGRLISLPILWVRLMASTTAAALGRPDLHRLIREAAVAFARDIEGDLSVVQVPLLQAGADMMTKFADVDLDENPGRAFWRAMDHGPVRRDLGGTPGHVDVAAVSAALRRFLPERLVLQFEQFRPTA